MRPYYAWPESIRNLPERRSSQCSAQPHSSAARINAAASSYALHLTFRQTKTRRLHSSRRSIIDMQSLAQGPHHRSLNGARSRSNDCSIQTHIFNQQSARAAVCARSYYFVHPEPLNITKSASSSTPSQEKDYRLYTRQSERGSAVGIRTRLVSSSSFQARHATGASFRSLNITASACLVNPLTTTTYRATPKRTHNLANRDQPSTPHTVHRK